MRRIVVVGDVVTDVLALYTAPLAPGSDTPAAIRFAGGGAGANTAAWLAAAGAPVTLVGVVGVDQTGDARLAELAAAGVACAVRRSPDAPTGAIIVLSGGGDRTMLPDRGANALLRPADVAELPTDTGHVHVSGYTLFDPHTRPAARAALRGAAARGATTSVDAASAAPLRAAPDFLSWLAGTDLLLANRAEAAVLAGAGEAGAQAAHLARRLGGAAVVKCGPAGAVWAGADGAAAAVPAEPATEVDPTGAGDAFAAGLLAAWLGGAGPAEALRAGARLGARAVRTVGARPPR
jgi:sugar/nucleoside kinase (ribokinase family)